MILSDKILHDFISKYGKEKGVKIFSLVELLIVVCYFCVIFASLWIDTSVGIVISLIASASLTLLLIYKLIKFVNEMNSKENEYRSKWKE